MTLYVHRSQRSEGLVASLAAFVGERAEGDPFAPLPIMVGSRGMERWLRHELATRLGSAAVLAFPMPGSTLDAAARWLLEGDASAASGARFWERGPATARDGWSGSLLAARVIAALRARLGDAGFERVASYVQRGPGGDAPVSSREFGFGRDVASVVERLLHDRPAMVRAWRAGERVPPEHAWIATLLADLHASAPEPSPADRFAALSTLAPRETGRALAAFGLSTLRPGDKARLAALARHLDVHVFALVPSSEWWADLAGRREQVRALAGELSPAARSELLASFERQNVLLATDGIPSRDLQIWLEQNDCRDEDVSPAPAATPTLLGALQRWLDEAGDMPARGAWRHLTERASIQVHASHGPLRQCEALRDELLRRFAADPTLEPRDVLVMTPDVATYAPLLAAVFGRRGNSAGGVEIPRIEVSIADLGLRASNPVADALLRALALADDRVTSARLLEVLELEPVRARFGLGEDEVADVRAMVSESGIRWAWSAGDRRRHDQPEVDQNTVRFGLERLALGVLMPDRGGLAVVRGAEGTSWAPAVPLPLETRARVARFGRLAAACAELEGVRARVADPATAAEWRDRLRQLVADLTRVSDERTWLRASVHDAIDDLLPDGGEPELRYDLGAVSSLLAGAFELPQRGDRPPTSAVTVCALEPMRSVPFRVIALVGMDDAAFPRASREPAWSPLSRAAWDEYDRRTVDRHMFLEALLSARDALLVYGTGFEPTQVKEVPLTVVATELVELLAHALDVDAATLVTRHPLQPWSARSFERDALRPFDQTWANVASELARQGEGPKPLVGLAASSLDARWPADATPGSTLTAAELVRALTKPQRELVGYGLGLDTREQEAELSEREPLEADGLESWSLRSAAMAEPELDAPDAFTRLEQRLRGEGVLPAHAAGASLLADAVEAARLVHGRVTRLPGGAMADPPTFACSVRSEAEARDLIVTASAPQVREADDDLWLVWQTASESPNGRARLLAWTSLLVATLDTERGERVRGAVIVGCADGAKGDYDGVVHFARPVEARRSLERLIEVRRLVRSGPVWLFPMLSAKLGVPPKKEASAADRVRDAAEACWCKEVPGTPFAGDLADRWVSDMFGHLGVEDLVARADALVALAETVWSDALGEGVAGLPGAPPKPERKKAAAAPAGATSPAAAKKPRATKGKGA